MKYIFTISLSIILFLNAHGQRYFAQRITTPHLKELAGRTFVVVPFPNNAYDRTLVKSMEDFWTLTPFKVGTPHAVDSLRRNCNHALLYFAKIVPQNVTAYGVFSCSYKFPFMYSTVVPQEVMSMKTNEKELFLKRSEDAGFLTPFYILRIQYSLREYYSSGKIKVPRLKLKHGERALYNKNCKDSLKAMKIYILEDIMTSDGAGRFAAYLGVSASNVFRVSAEELSRRLYERNQNYAFIYENDEFKHMVYNSQGKWLALGTSLGPRKNRKILNEARRMWWTGIGIAAGCITGLAILGMTVGND